MKALSHAFKALLLTTFTLLTIPAMTQVLEGGIFLGGMNYEGDFTPDRLYVHETNPAFGIYVRYNMAEYFTIRFSGNYGQITGTDENSEGDLGRLRRNLHFRSNILETGFQLEWNILGMDPMAKKSFSPYLFGGVHYFHHNPQAELRGTWYDLQPLGTEGQGLQAYPDRYKYKLHQVSFPLGLGMKVGLSETIKIGLEVGVRMTMFDYLDDLSTTFVSRQELILENGFIAADLAHRTGEFVGTPPQEPIDGAPRGNPNNNDWYVLGGVTLGYSFVDAFGGRRGTPCPSITY